MKDQSYWKTHYVVRGEADETARHITVRDFSSGRVGSRFCASKGDMTDPASSFPRDLEVIPTSSPNSDTRCTADDTTYSLCRNMAATGCELMERHREALESLTRTFNGRVGVYAEGLGGYVAFYLGLAHSSPMKSLVCQNASALMTDPAYHEALVRDTGPWTGTVRRRKLMLLIAQALVRLLPGIKIPIWTYWDWKARIDTREGTYEVERRLVEDGYPRDPDFDTRFTLSHVMSLVSTPPNPLRELGTPTMFVLARGGPTPAYIKTLYDRWPPIKKRLREVHGSIYWMLSHPVEAADAVCRWFDETL